jgi:excisionase family DNA binding protein
MQLPEFDDRETEAQRRRMKRDLASAPIVDADEPADPLDDPAPSETGDHDTPPPRGPPVDLPLLLTAPEVAHELRVSQRQVFNLAKQKQLEIVRIGRSVRFTRASVLALAGAAEAA